MKNSRTSLFLLLLFAVSFLISCEEKSVESKPTESDAQLTANDLITALSMDNAMIEYVSNKYKAASVQKEWLNSLSKEKRASYITNLRNSETKGFGSMTESQRASFEKAQWELAQTIQNRFPQLSQLSDSERSEIRNKATYAILRASSDSMDRDPCFDGWNACSWSCVDSGNGPGSACQTACNKGYDACLGMAD